MDLPCSADPEHREPAGRELDVAYVDLQLMSCEGLRLFDDLLARLDDGHPADDQRAGAVGVQPERCGAGVAVYDDDVVVGNAERIGCDLGERGLVALAVR